MNSEIKSAPFSWNDNFSEAALEDFQLIQEEWLKELRAYRKMYHKEHMDDCLRAESEERNEM